MAQLLGPPLPAARSNPCGSTALHAAGKLMAQSESSQVVYGIYVSADAKVGLFIALQNWFGGVTGCAVASKSVPPTATLKGVEAMPLTANPLTAAFGLTPVGSNPADPLSPVETTTVIP